MQFSKTQTGKKKARAADHKRQHHFLHPRRLGRRVGDAVLVGDCWSVCLYYFFVYQEISSMASARRVGLYGLCCSVHIVKLTIYY